MANHDAVAHSWAHQTGKNRKGFNMFYEGPTIYSYGHHFPIARLVDAPSGNRVVLFNAASYSVSTSKHQTLTRRAVTGRKVYEVPHIELGRPTYIEAEFHRLNHADILRRAVETYQKAARARINRPWLMERGDRLTQLANDYNAEFALGLPEALPGLADLRASIEAQQQAQREADAKAEAEREAREAEAIAKWTAGEDVRPPHTRLPFVRVKGETLETSWGIKVELEQALPLFRIAQRCATKGEAYRPAYEAAPMVDHYRLSEIDAKGTIKIGCHVLTLDRMTAAAERAGLL